MSTNQACFTQPYTVLMLVAVSEEKAPPAPFSRYAKIVESTIKTIGGAAGPEFTAQTLSTLRRAYDAEMQDLDAKVKAWITRYLEMMSAEYDATGRIIDVDEVANQYGGIIQALQAQPVAG